MKKILLGICSFGLFSIIFSGHASAITPNDFPDHIKAYFSNYDANCSSIPEKLATAQWMAPAGNPRVSSVNVPYGTTSVGVEFHIVSMLCRDRMASISGATYPGLPRDGIPNGVFSPPGRRINVTSQRNMLIDASATDGTVSGAPIETVWNRNDSSRYWISTTIPLTYNASSAMTSSRVVSIVGNTAVINVLEYTSIVSCINQANGTPSGTNAGNYYQPGRCARNQPSFSLVVNVEQPPVARVQGYVVRDTCAGGAIGVGGTVSAGSASSSANPFFLDTAPGDNTMSISGINSNYEVVGYCWGSASGSPTAATSFVRYLAPGSTTDMRWVVRERLAVVQGYVVENSCGGSSVDVGVTVTAGSASAVPGSSPFFLVVNPGSVTMSIYGVSPDYDVIGYCWGDGGALTGNTSFNRNIAPGSVTNMRWVVRGKPAALNGFVVRQGDGSPMGATVGISNVACEGTTDAFDAACAPFPGGSHDANRAVYFNTVPAGNGEIVVHAVETGYEVVGSKICLNYGRVQAGIPSCNDPWSSTSAIPSGAGYFAGNPRNHVFLANANYSIRWIIRPTAPGCVAPSIISPSVVDVSTNQFTVRAGAQFGSSAAANYVFSQPTARYRIYLQTPAGAVVSSPAGVPLGGVANGTGGITATLTGSTISFEYTFNGAVPNAGSYRIVGNMDHPEIGIVGIGGVPSGNCSTVQMFANKPYFMVKNGDIQLGAAMPNNAGICGAVNNKAGVATWNRGGSEIRFGASGSHATMALNAIQDFATNELTGSGGTGLSFANTGSAIPAGRWGGYFGAYQDCIKDYYGTKPATTGTFTGGVLPTTSGSYTMTGTNIDASTLGAGQKIVIYKDGNVHINANITVRNTDNYTAAGLGGLPSLYVIATGDITIDPNVRYLFGTFVAQGRATDTNITGGTIYTCGRYSATVGDVTNIKPIKRYAECGPNAARLTVMGSLIARNYSFTRSVGTVSQASTPAELIRYSPFTWLAPSAIDATDRSVLSVPYDSITSLPPVL